MPDRATLSQVLVLLVTLSQDFTEAAADNLGAGNTSNRQVQILMALHESGPMAPSELATILGMSRSSMSHALARFEEEELISRAVDTRDRRSVRLALTTRGQGRMRSLDAALEAALIKRGPQIRAALALAEWPTPLAQDAGITPRQAVKGLAAAGVAFVEEVLPGLREYGVIETSDRFALALIHDHGVVRPTRLAEDLRMSSSGTCTLLDRLVAEGLVQRAPGAGDGDRRAVQVSLTERGRDAAEVSLNVLRRQWPDLGAKLASTMTTPAKLASTMTTPSTSSVA